MKCELCSRLLDDPDEMRAGGARAIQDLMGRTVCQWCFAERSQEIDVSKLQTIIVYEGRVFAGKPLRG